VVWHILYQYIKAPLYVVQDLTDMFLFQTNIGSASPQEVDTTPKGQEFAAYLSNCAKTSMTQIMNHPQGKQGDGMFLPACYAHGGNSKALVEGFTRRQALGNWFFGRTDVPLVLTDACGSMPPYLPCTEGCKHFPQVVDESECQAALQSACGVVIGKACRVCAGQNLKALASAGCTKEIIETLC